MLVRRERPDDHVRDLGKFRVVVAEPGKTDPARVVEKVGSGEEEFPVRHRVRLLDFPSMVFRSYLADLLVGGFHERMVRFFAGNGKLVFPMLNTGDRRSPLREDVLDNFCLFHADKFLVKTLKVVGEAFRIETEELKHGGV